jgi:hypothetical protein
MCKYKDFLTKETIKLDAIIRLNTPTHKLAQSQSILISKLTELYKEYSVLITDYSLYFDLCWNATYELHILENKYGKVHNKTIAKRKEKNLFESVLNACFFNNIDYRDNIFIKADRYITLKKLEILWN